ncbi:MAG: hypothetical protein V1859_02190 [archaeon]
MVEWELVSWILRGRLKRKIIKSFDKPKTATSLSKELKTHRSTISSIIIEFEKKGILLCLDKGQPYNRFYKITSFGEAVVKEIDNIR